jgi:hypothetical protein
VTLCVVQQEEKKNHLSMYASDTCNVERKSFSTAFAMPANSAEDNTLRAPELKKLSLRWLSYTPQLLHNRVQLTQCKVILLNLFNRCFKHRTQVLSEIQICFSPLYTSAVTVTIIVTYACFFFDSSRALFIESSMNQAIGLCRDLVTTTWLVHVSVVRGIQDPQIQKTQPTEFTCLQIR